MHFRNVNGYFVCILEKAIGSHGTMGTDSSELPCRYHKSSRTASSGLNHSSPATNFFLNETILTFKRLYWIHSLYPAGFLTRTCGQTVFIIKLENKPNHNSVQHAFFNSRDIKSVAS